MHQCSRLCSCPCGGSSIAGLWWRRRKLGDTSAVTTTSVNQHQCDAGGRLSFVRQHAGILRRSPKRSRQHGFVERERPPWGKHERWDNYFYGNLHRSFRPAAIQYRPGRGRKPRRSDEIRQRHRRNYQRHCHFAESECGQRRARSNTAVSAEYHEWRASRYCGALEPFRSGLWIGVRLRGFQRPICCATDSAFFPHTHVDRAECR